MENSLHDGLFIMTGKITIRVQQPWRCRCGALTAGYLPLLSELTAARQMEAGFESKGADLLDARRSESGASLRRLKGERTDLFCIGRFL